MRWLEARPLSTALVLALTCLASAEAHAGARRPGLCAAAATEDASPAYLAVLSAYPAELAPIAAATAIEGTVQIGSRAYYVGRLSGVNVLLGLTGIGVANATDAARDLLARRDIAGVVMSGTGGTRHHIGDVVLASELTEAEQAGTFRPNPSLVALAQRAADTLPEPLERCTLVPPGAPDAERVCLLFDPVVIFGGQLVTIDPFGGEAVACTPGAGEVYGCGLPPTTTTTSAVPETGSSVHPLTITTVDLEDMESAAVARVAARRRVPFLAVRSASDGGGDPLGDRGFPAQFFDYYRIATHNAGTVTRAVVAELGRLAGDRRTCALLAQRRWGRATKRIARP